MPPLPPDLQGLTDAMTAADDAAEALAGGLADDEFFWQPDGGQRWSVALCLDHLAIANATYGAAMTSALAEARERGWVRRGPVVPGFFGRKFAESLEPPVKRRTRAPGKIQPQPARSRAEILTAYRAAHDVIRGLLMQAATLDANRAAFKNPFIGVVRVRVSSAFHIVAAHDRRHLWQAQQVVASLRGKVQAG